MWKIRLVAFLIFICGIAMGFFVYFSEIKPESFLGRFPFKLGLDLKGGTLLTYEADVSEVSSGEVESSLESLRYVIERRVNIFGVSEPLVQVERAGILNASQKERLIVELPGVTDIDEAIKALGETPTLDFRLLKADGNSLLNSTDKENLLDRFEPTGLTGRFLDRASLEFDQTSGEPIVTLQFNSEGKELFAKITKENVGRVLAIFLDGAPISTPVIREEIPDGKAVISGAFNPEEARALARDLNYGALPVPISLVGTQTIGASLGEGALVASVKAGIIGSLLVLIFMAFWYRVPGIIAGLSLLLYVVIMLAFFKLIPVTLTAAGLAGLILSVGMAVDANVLIFERIKEELRAGKVIDQAIKEGFLRAWLSIRDANITTLITAGVLYWLGGTALIKGFALVFILGVLVSMFTAISVTRTFLISFNFGNSKIMSFLFGSGFSK